MTPTPLLPWPNTPPSKTRKPYKKKKTAEDKVIEAVTEGGGALVTPAIVANLEPTIKAEIADKDNYAFKPNPGPQTEFLASSEREVFYGGAKGGGKTQALMVAPLRFCSFPTARALLLRRTMPDLRDVIFKAQTIYPKAFPGVKWKDQEKCFYFPSGARIEFGYAETEADVVRYHGQNYTFIGVDELPQFPFAQTLLNYLRSNIRSIDPINVPPLFRATGNPGEISSDLVKKEFIGDAIPGTTFWQTTEIYDPRIKAKKKILISKKFIKATIFDNPHLLQDDSYLATLASLPEVKRKQWLDGDWDVSDNSAFPEFDRNIHVVAPFDIPRQGKKLRGCDWGYSSPGCVLWGCTMPDGQLVIYKEFVFQGKVGLKVAQEGKAMEMGDNVGFGVMDTSAWSRRGELGQSVGEIFQMYWGKWIPSSRTRTLGKANRVISKQQVHEYLALNPMTGKPRMVIFPTCPKLISSLAGLPKDKNNPEDVDTDSNLDHYYDALRYLLMGRPTVLGSWTGDIGSRAPPVSYRPVDPVFGG